MMGSHVTTQEVSKVTQKIIFNILQLYSVTPLLRIFTYLYQVLSSDGNDRGLSLLTSLYYKPLFDRSLQPNTFL